MHQDALNKIKIADWDEEGIYQERFRLRLTRPHALVVGRWDLEGEWGVDLRRWSYHEGRLLLSGITLNSDTWESLFAMVSSLHSDGVFRDYGACDPNIYCHSIDIGDHFTLHTDVYTASLSPFLSVCLKKGDRMLWRARGTPIGILLRFDTMADFVAKARECQLAKKTVVKEQKITDSKTGRVIF